MMLAFEPPSDQAELGRCDCAICVALRTIWPDTVAAVAEHFDLDDAEAEQHVLTYAPTIPRMTQ